MPIKHYSVRKITMRQHNKLYSLWQPIKGTAMPVADHFDGIDWVVYPDGIFEGYPTDHETSKIKYSGELDVFQSWKYIRHDIGEGSASFEQHLVESDKRFEANHDYL